MNNDLREELIGPFASENEWGGARNFSNLPLNVLQQLIQEGFVEMEPWQSCPGVAAMFLPFLSRYPTFTAHGYVVSRDREDSRITVEGIEKHGTLLKSELVAFAKTFCGADEFELSYHHARCWYAYENNNPFKHKIN